MSTPGPPAQLPPPEPPPGLLDTAAKKAAALTALIVLATTAFGAYKLFRPDPEACTFAGTVHQQFSNEAYGGAFIGYATDRDQVLFGQRPNLVKLAESAPDGTYSADCTGAEDSDGADSFEVLTWNGPNATLPGLPCLSPESVAYTAIRLPNKGDRTGINVSVKSC